MKLASKNNGQRDGGLILVSNDLCRAQDVADIAKTLQQAIDHWDTIAPSLEKIYQQLNQDASFGYPLELESLLAPLPRAYQWLDSSAYLNHVELLRKARKAPMPTILYEQPLMYQGVSDCFLPPMSKVDFNPDWGIDFEAEVAVVTKDVPKGVTATSAHDYIILCGLVNDISLRHLIPVELSKGFGFLHSKPPCQLSPVLVTLDELGDAWKDSKIHLLLQSRLNGKTFGTPNAGVDMHFNFSELIAHGAKTRPLTAGTIIGSGTVSNYEKDSGFSCIAEKRMEEIIEYGKTQTNFLQPADKVEILMLGPKGNSLFGTIECEIFKSDY